MNLGILGAGQLARMIAEAATRMGYAVTVLAASRDEPAAQVAPRTIIGQSSDPKILGAFLAQVDQVLIENEWLPFAALKALGVPSDSPKFCPSLTAIEVLQDKYSQKELLQKLSIPTARFQLLPASLMQPGAEAGLNAFLADRKAEWGAAPVLKYAREGYDGKGTWISGKSSDQTLTAGEFVGAAFKRGIRVYAEERIEFTEEVALVGCRSQAEWAHYPLVTTRQERGICVEVHGPHPDKKLDGVAAAAAKRLALETGLIGVFAIEFFVGRDGGLLANEIAPRVHNSGHFSLDAAATSQFENHVRACLGLPLGSTQTGGRFGMLNLIGIPPEKVAPLSTLLQLGWANVHWYGKRETRPGRKMGHVNFKAESESDFLNKRAAILRAIEVTV